MVEPAVGGLFGDDILHLLGVSPAATAAQDHDTHLRGTPLFALGTLALLIVLRRHRTRWPGSLIAMVLATGITALLKLPVETIVSHFGPIPRAFPTPHVSSIDLARVSELLPSAFTIALLGGVESLLWPVVAAGMIRGRHRSNCELVAQCIASGASALLGGLPATGAIVRTATAVRAGARSPGARWAHPASSR